MARGGRRDGAGRRKGTGPTRLGKTSERVAVAKRALTEGLNPLDYMLSILRDENLEQKERFAAAKEAAPYVHPRLAAVEHKGDADNPLAFVIQSGVMRPEEHAGEDEADQSYN